LGFVREKIYSFFFFYTNVRWTYTDNGGQPRTTYDNVVLRKMDNVAKPEHEPRTTKTAVSVEVSTSQRRASKKKFTDSVGRKFFSERWHAVC
jgi:hypothetical protein